MKRDVCTRCDNTMDNYERRNGKRLRIFGTKHDLCAACTAGLYLFLDGISLAVRNPFATGGAIKTGQSFRKPPVTPLKGAS